MKCSKVQKNLSAYQDGELKSGERDKVTMHLQDCQVCCKQYAELDRVWQTLGELQEIHPDPWFYRQVVRKIKEPREQGLLPTLQHVFRLFRAPVAVSIILIIGLVAGSNLGSLLARCDLFPLQNKPLSDSREVFTSMRVFDPAPPGTFAEGYLRMVSYKENESR